MKRDIIDIVKEKDFTALTASERNELADLCSTEVEYNQLKSVLLDVDAVEWSNPQPKNETKERLDVLFAKTYPKAAITWYSSALILLVPKDKQIHRQPLLQIAALILFLFITVPFFSSEDLSSEDVVVAENTVSQENINTEESSTEVDNDIPETNEIVTIEIEDAKRDVVSEQETVVASRSIRNNFGETGTVHSDGVFTGNVAITYSLPASEQPEDLFDLLTTSF